MDPHATDTAAAIDTAAGNADGARAAAGCAHACGAPDASRRLVAGAMRDRQ